MLYFFMEVKANIIMKNENMDEIDKMLYAYFDACRKKQTPKKLTEFIDSIDLSKYKQKQNLISKLRKLWK